MIIIDTDVLIEILDKKPNYTYDLRHFSQIESLGLNLFP
jgi:hypothetical protein